MSRLKTITRSFTLKQNATEYHMPGVKGYAAIVGHNQDVLIRSQVRVLGGFAPGAGQPTAGRHTSLLGEVEHGVTQGV